MSTSHAETKNHTSHFPFHHYDMIKCKYYTSLSWEPAVVWFILLCVYSPVKCETAIYNPTVWQLLKHSRGGLKLINLPSNMQFHWIIILPESYAHSMGYLVISGKVDSYEGTPANSLRPENQHPTLCGGWLTLWLNLNSLWSRVILVQQLIFPNLAACHISVRFWLLTTCTK